MERKPEQISRDIAAFERKLSEAGANEVLIEALNKKLSKLKNELKGGQMSTRQLASNLLGARKKVREMAAKDFRELISRLARKPEYYFLKKYSKTEIKDDMARPAKPVGYRFVGRGNYEVPSKRQIRNGLIDGTVYSERRPKRSDVSRVAQLAKGGKIETFFKKLKSKPRQKGTSNLYSYEFSYQDAPYIKITDLQQIKTMRDELQDLMKEHIDYKYNLLLLDKKEGLEIDGYRTQISVEDLKHYLDLSGLVKKDRDLAKKELAKIAMFAIKSSGLKKETYGYRGKSTQSYSVNTLTKMAKGGSMYATGGEVAKYHTLGFYKGENVAMIFSSKSSEEFGPNKGGYTTSEKYTNLTGEQVKNMLPKFMKEYGLRKQSDLVKEVMSGKMAKGGRIDLFEDYENIPEKVQVILDRYSDEFGGDGSDMDYKDTQNMLEEVEAVGYTFGYGLDNEPYGLRPIGVKLNELRDYEDFEDEEMAKGGEVGKSRDFIVKIDLYEKYKDGSDFKKEMKLKAKNIYDLFEKLYNKNTGISYYIRAFEFEETEELKQMSDKDLCKLLDEEMAKSSNNNYFTIIEIIDGNEIVLAGGDRKYEFGYEYMAKGGEAGNNFNYYDGAGARMLNELSLEDLKFQLKHTTKPNEKERIALLEKLIEQKSNKFDNGGEISVYNLRKGDKVRTRKGDIETIIKKTGSGSYETIENDYSHSPESLEFVSRPGHKMAHGGMLEHGLQVGDEIMTSAANLLFVRKNKKIYVININTGKRLTQSEWDKMDNKNQNDFSRMATGGQVDDVQAWIRYDGYSDKQIEGVFDGLEEAGYDFPKDFKIYEKSNQESFNNKVWDKSNAMSTDIRIETLPGDLTRKDVSVIIYGMIMTASTQYGLGGDIKAFFSATKETLKKGYNKSKEYTKKKIHDTSKKIALDVIDSTKDKVRSNKDKMTLKGAEEIVTKKYAKGGEIDKLPSNLQSRLNTANKLLVMSGGRGLTAKEAIRWNIDNNSESGFVSGQKAIYLVGGDESNIKQKDYYIIGDALIDISEKMTGVTYDLYDFEIEKYLQGKGDKQTESQKETALIYLQNNKFREGGSMTKMATGGNVNNYPSFEVTKTIRVDDMMITPGYYTYTGRENGGKGVYLNVHTKQTLGFDLDMLKSLNEKHPTDIQILMKKGGRVKKGNYSYIPQEEIDYLVTEYGKKIDGNKLLDGAYAKGNTKAPKITRTQFEEEDYEFAKGGEISVYNLRKGDRVKTRKGDIETIIKKTGSGSYETIENDYTHSPESLEFVSRPGRKMATGGGVSKRKTKGDVGKSGTQYGYTLKEYELAGEKYGLFVSPSQFWKSQDGKKYKDFIGRTQTTGERDKQQVMMGYGYRIAIGLDLGSDKIPASAKKYVQDNNLNKFDKGGNLKKGNYSYIPQEEIDYLVTEYGKKIDGNKLLDGAYAKGNTKAPKMVRSQFEEEDYEFANGGSMGSRVNYQNDDFALVMLGGSIGSKTSLPIFVNGKMGSIVESGNNKEMLKEKAARMRKQLSAGERKHYGMSYTVVALTPAKIKEIERFKNN